MHRTCPNRMTAGRHAVRMVALTAALPVALFASAAAQAPDAGVTVADDTVRTPMHAITVGDAALPRQVVIRPAVEELPLELRGEAAELPESELIAIGRGPRLAGPMRIEVETDDGATPAEATTAATLVEQTDTAARYEAGLSAGVYKVSLAATYAAHGAMRATAEITTSGDPAGPLVLAIPLAGPADIAYTPQPESLTPAKIVPKELDASVGTDEGVVWSSAAGAAVRRLFVGTGDAGFAFETDKPWTPSAERPLASIVRDDAGRATWRIVLADGPLGKSVTREFALRVLPDRRPPAGRRRLQWLEWPDDAAQADPPRGWVFDDHAPRELTGAEAAAIVSAERDHVALYPNSLMQALTAPCAARAQRIVPNVRRIAPGDEPAFDRQVIGRALLHDAGVAAAGLSQPVELLRVIAGLRKFGFFADENTEYIPYWRSSDVVRFGEAFDPDSDFNLTTADPSAGTYVSVFRRPLTRDGRRGVQVLFVVMNQRDEPIRARLYVLNPQRVFGGEGSTLTGLDCIRRLDFGDIPDDSDWRREKLTTWRYTFEDAGLMDVEDDGFVRESSSKGQTSRIYGPVFVRADDFRVLYGEWLPAPDEDRQTR